MAARIDDQTLVELCRAGKTEAFGTLVQRYQDRLYPTIFRLTGVREDALDILQEAFLKAFQQLHRFQGESSFYTWVYRIAVNLALSARRRRGWRPLVDASGVEVDPTDPSSPNDPSEPLVAREREQRIQSALASLLPDHRAVVVLKDLDGLPYEEIALLLKIPVGTVRSRLHRARCELRAKLSDLMADGPVPQTPLPEWTPVKP